MTKEEFRTQFKRAKVEKLSYCTIRTWAHRDLPVFVKQVDSTLDGRRRFLALVKDEIGVSIVNDRTKSKEAAAAIAIKSIGRQIAAAG